MADKKIRLKEQNQDGTYDYLFPATKSDIVDVKGKTLDTVLAETDVKITENNENFTAQLAQIGKEGIDVTSFGILPNSGDVSIILNEVIQSLTKPTTLVFSSGVYEVANTIILNKSNITFKLVDSEIKAIAPMKTVLWIGHDVAPAFTSDIHLTGVGTSVINANYLADHCYYGTNARRSFSTMIQFKNQKTIAVLVEVSPQNPNSTYPSIASEFNFYKFVIDRDDYMHNEDIIGMVFKTSDCHVIDGKIMHQTISIQNYHFNHFKDIHGWGIGEFIKRSIFFDIYGTSMIYDCYADTYHIDYCFNNDSVVRMSGISSYINESYYDVEKVGYNPVYKLFFKEGVDFTGRIKITNGRFSGLVKGKGYFSNRSDASKLVELATPFFLEIDDIPIYGSEQKRFLRETEKGTPKVYYNYSGDKRLKDGYGKVKLIETTIIPEDVDPLFTGNTWEKVYYDVSEPNTNIAISSGVLNVSGSQLMGVRKKITLRKGWHFFRISTKNDQSLRVTLRKDGSNLRDDVIPIRIAFDLHTFFVNVEKDGEYEFVVSNEVSSDLPKSYQISKPVVINLTANGLLNGLNGEEELRTRLIQVGFITTATKQPLLDTNFIVKSFPKNYLSESILKDGDVSYKQGKNGLVIEGKSTVNPNKTAKIYMDLTEEMGRRGSLFVFSATDEIVSKQNMHTTTVGSMDIKIDGSFSYFKNASTDPSLKKFMVDWENEKLEFSTIISSNDQSIGQKYSLNDFMVTALSESSVYHNSVNTSKFTEIPIFDDGDLYLQVENPRGFAGYEVIVFE